LRVLYHQDFEALWSIWPNKTKKRDSYGAWQNKGYHAPTYSELARIAASHADYYQKSGTPRRFIPTLETWISRDRWEDELGDPYERDARGQTPEDTGIIPDNRYDAQGNYVGVQWKEN
jgi:hypothetical protein